MVPMKQSRFRVEQLEDRSLLSANPVLEWNQLTLDAIRLTNTSTPLASRALAITQAAVYDAVNAIDGSYAPYAFSGHAPPGASLGAAAAVAAHDTLVELFPTRRADFDAALASSLAAIPDGSAENKGVAVGNAAAASILALRRHDGSDATVPYTPGADPGDWQPTPPTFSAALATQWPQVTPFAMTAGSQFRPPAPPALDSDEYAAAFNEVFDLGRNTSATRTADQTEIAMFWRDGAGTSYAFGHWNTIAQNVAEAQGLDMVSDARLFALLNMATADAIISCWDAKYEYNFWRPVTAIRAADTDGNPETTADTSWTPLIGTPNFPSYTSAHSTVSGAAAAILTDWFGSDYQFTTGSEGSPGVTRTFDNFEEAATEAGRSRVYGGIHFQFDSTVGLAAGAEVGDYVLNNFLLPRGGPAAAPVKVNISADHVQPVQVTGMDDNAAGWSWFVGSTPWDDFESIPAGDQGERGRMELFSRRPEADGTAGSRQTISPDLPAHTGGLSPALTAHESVEAETWIGSDHYGRKM